MPRLIQLAKPFRPDRLTPVLRIKGVNVFVHWSVFAIAAIMLLGTIRRPVMTLVGVACYLSVILIHECGHMAAAQRKGYAVDGIFLYPIHGLCTFEMPWSRFDHCVIAWGGVLAQAAVALPLIAWLAVFGYTRFDAVNAVLAILGCYSLLVAVFNLIPAGRLDGALAWGLIPEWIKRVRTRRNKRPNKRTTDWRTY
jgi:stage IV sporulation protein FB